MANIINDSNIKVETKMQCFDLFLIYIIKAETAPYNEEILKNIEIILVSLLTLLIPSSGEGPQFITINAMMCKYK